MKLSYFEEPELQFGDGLHLDNKFGLLNLGPFDIHEKRRPEKILIGLVGSPQSNTGVRDWFKRIGNGVAAKTSKKPNLFPRYPSDADGMPFRSELVFDLALQVDLHTRDYVPVSAKPEGIERLQALAGVFIDKAKDLQNKGANIVVIAIPGEAFPLFGQASEDDDAADEEEATPVATPVDGVIAPVPVAEEKKKPRVPYFHDVLKACAMQEGVVIQMIRPSTYDDSMKRKETDSYGRRRRLQDPATRAWNIVTGIYYKAGGTPWRIPRKDHDLDTCYLGVSFFKTVDEKTLQTSVAQVFNERGYGLIVRGGEATFNKDDRQVHLDEKGMEELVSRALNAYSGEHHHLPARLMVHKSSQFSPSEIKGVKAAVAKASIGFTDMISLRSSFTRLFRDGYYPPLRGTCLELNDQEWILYTRGTVYFYEEYPGMYVPKSLMVRFDDISSSKEEICRSLLLLSKMNWNNTQMDEVFPITLRAAHQVGTILKHVPEDGRIEPHYKFYM